MEVILNHENVDFGAVASSLGASKLFPAAIPVLPRRVNRNGCALLVDTQGLATLKGMSCRFSVHQLTRVRDQERG